jgi:hypothetical protein
MSGKPTNPLAGGKPPRLFLSYATEDRPLVDELRKMLDLAGYGPWLDHEDLYVGQELTPELEKAIDQAALFLACLTPAYARKAGQEGYVRAELSRALAIGRQRPGSLFVLPVMLEQCEVGEDLPLGDLVRCQGWGPQETAQLMRSIRRSLEERGLIGITVLAGEDPTAPTKIWHLGGASLGVGRAPSNHIVLDDRQVSGFHAVLAIRKNQVRLLHSSESKTTTVIGPKREVLLEQGGERSTRLEDGDRIKLGGTTLTIRLSGVDLVPIAVTTTE